MVKEKKQKGFGVERSFIQTQPGFVRMPVINTTGQQAIREAQKLFSKKALQGELQKLATRKTSLENVLLGFARGAAKSLDTVLSTENQVADREKTMNEEYRASLIARKEEAKPRRARKGKKDEFLITGQVLHPKTGEPVPGMVVEAIDKDVFKHDLLGVDTTNAEGRYEISFLKKDFKESGEDLPEVILRVGVDRKTAVHITEDVIKAEPGKRAQVEISLPEDQIRTIDRVLTKRERLDQKRLNNVAQTLTFESLQHVILQEMGAAFKDSLNNAIAFLEALTKDTDKIKTKPGK